MFNVIWLNKISFSFGASKTIMAMPAFNMKILMELIGKVV